MSDVDVAAVLVARSLAYAGRVFVLGDAGTAGGFAARRVAPDGAEQSLRAGARAGDCLIVVGSGGVDARARDRILRRLPAWGVTEVSVASADEFAAVVAAANGLVGDDEALRPAVVEGADEVCITCSDEGRLGEVVTAPAAFFEPAIVRTPAGEEDVDVTLVGDVAAFDLVLIHAGGAIARVPDGEVEVIS